MKNLIAFLTSTIVIVAVIGAHPSYAVPFASFSASIQGPQPAEVDPPIPPPPPSARGFGFVRFRDLSPGELTITGSSSLPETEVTEKGSGTVTAGAMQRALIQFNNFDFPPVAEFKFGPVAGQVGPKPGLADATQTGSSQLIKLFNFSSDEVSIPFDVGYSATLKVVSQDGGHAFADAIIRVFDPSSMPMQNFFFLDEHISGTAESDVRVTATRNITVPGSMTTPDGVVVPGTRSVRILGEAAGRVEVPGPSSAALLGIGLFGLIVFTWARSDRRCIVG